MIPTCCEDSIRYEPAGIPRLTATYLLVAHMAADEEFVRCLADDGRPMLLKRGGILAVSERFDVCALLVEVADFVTIGHVVR